MRGATSSSTTSSAPGTKLPRIYRHPCMEHWAPSMTIARADFARCSYTNSIGERPTVVFMDLALHKQFELRKLLIGSERAPLIVIDNFVANAEDLVDLAAGKRYLEPTQFYPGLRAKAPLSYQQLITEALKPTLVEYFGVDPGLMRFTMAHFSLVTKAAGSLVPLQRIPHVDAAEPGLAMVHYLFKEDFGGTAFYRHRATGFEVIPEGRKQSYYPLLQQQMAGPDAPPNEYINGDTALFEQVAVEQGVFNRALIYRRNSLHSGAIPKGFVPNADPAKGR